MVIYVNTLSHCCINRGIYCIYESESSSVLSDSLQPHGLYSPWKSPGQNTGVGYLSLLQGIFPSPLRCRWILYQLSHQGRVDRKAKKKPENVVVE